MSTDMTSGNMPDISGIMSRTDLSARDKQLEILKLAGKRGSKKKYGSVAERKKAQKERSAQRRKENNDFLYSIGAKKKKEILSPEEKKAHKLARRERKKVEKQGINRLIIDHPEIAKEYGLNPDRVSKFSKVGRSLKPPKKIKKGKGKGKGKGQGKGKGKGKK